jgi:hypothetical protein
MKNCAPLLFLLILLLSGCVGTTVITSTPTGAVVFIDGEEKGATPYVHKDRKVSFSKTPVILVKAGYTNRETHIRKNQQFVAQNLLGLPLVFPLLYLVDYADTTHLNMASNELRQAVINEEDLLKKDPVWLRNELEQLEAAYKAKVIDRKPYKRQRRQLKSYLKEALQEQKSKGPK